MKNNTYYTTLALHGDIPYDIGYVNTTTDGRILTENSFEC